MRKLTIMVTMIGLLPTAALAQECQTYLNKTPQLISIDDALALFADVTEKGEFESTEQYRTRISAATQNHGPLVIEKPIDNSQLVYDADHQYFRIGRHLFDNENMPIQLLWMYDGPFPQKYRPRDGSIDVVIRSEEKITGTYQASNAFGASTEVLKIDRIQWGVYDRPVEFSGGTTLASSSLVPISEGEDYLGTLPMSSAEARRFKESAKIAIAVIPKAPWRIHYRKSTPYQATIHNPKEVTSVLNILFADIKCALLLDSSNTVVSAFTTR